ncbi:MAG TPA: hypothetical protein VFV54_01505 [Thermoanaerobaculia bacterium]|nr:hypothetical protein [Thermoanaerobaculia bacterium]
MRTGLALALLLAALPASAQQKTDVTVRQVNDRRSKGFFSELTLALELPKLKSAEVAASRVFVKSAADDAGGDLVDHEASEPQFEWNPRAAMKDAPPMPAMVSVKLKNPARKARKVSAVSGEIELYLPGKDPNSIAEIPKFVTMGGKVLGHKALKANGVEIAMLSEAQIETERSKRVEAKKKEYAEMGYEGEDLENAVRSATEGLLAVEENELLVRIKDPEKRIQEISYVDSAGEVKMVSTRDEEGVVLLSTWGGTPQPDWAIRVSMRTPKNVVRYAFALTDVPLP